MRHRWGVVSHPYAGINRIRFMGFKSKTSLRRALYQKIEKKHCHPLGDKCAFIKKHANINTLEPYR